MSHEVAPSLDELESLVEAKYKAAMDGINALRDFLGDNTAVDNVRKANKHRANGASNRERVFAVMNGKWHTVDDLSKRSGLDFPSVRGVVYAKNLSTRLKKRKRRGRAEFRLTPAEGGEE